MTRNRLIFWLSILLLTQATAVASQEQQVRPAIAVLVWHESPNDLAALRGLKRGLAAMGMADGIVELKAEGDEQKARALLKGVAQKKVQLIIALGTKATTIASDEIKDIPIVFTAVTNPVLSGVTPSWAGSGRNICGNSNWLDRREMLRAFRLALPSMNKLAILRTPKNSVSRAEFEEARSVLSSFPGLQLDEITVKDAKKIREVLAKQIKKFDAIWVPIDFPLYQEEPLKIILEVAKEAKIPVFSSTPKCAGTGALVVMTVDYELLGLRASALVRDVLKGKKKPGEMKVGRLKSSRLFVDLAAARRIGLRLPFDLILAAHRLFGAEDK